MPFIRSARPLITSAYEPWYGRKAEGFLTNIVRFLSELEQFIGIRAT